jgi:hypothetical protein
MRLAACRRWVRLWPAPRSSGRRTRRWPAGEGEWGFWEGVAGPARSVSGVADAEAEVQLEEGQQSVTIKAVTVRILTGEPGQMLPVHPVQPVTPVGAPTSGVGPVDVKMSATEKRLADSVRREVAARLGLEADPGKVQVVIGTDRR